MLLRALQDRLDLTTVGVTGRPLGELVDEAGEPQGWQSTIRTLDDPLGRRGRAGGADRVARPRRRSPQGSAASPDLQQHTGPAVVFESAQDAVERLDDPGLEITKESVLVLRGSGPVGAGMPEAGSLPIPRALAAAGVVDMVRVSDARMSGTSYGTVVLHCTPESAVGGPLALVRNGDLIRLDVPGRRLDLLVDDDELARRRAQFTPPPTPERGWRRLYAERVLPASQGADLDFLQ